jgi:predicted Zn-dependent peptidase
MPDRRIAPDIKSALDFEIKLPPYSQFTLSSGAPVYYINDGAEEVVEIDFVFNAGDTFENSTGVATAVNRLIKNGTGKRNAFEINEYFEYYGAYLQRSCLDEIATISLHCLSKYLKELLPVVRELITESIFPQQEIDIFKQNSIQRLSVNLMKCNFVADRLIDKYLYGAHHPYGRYANREDIQAISREELTSFFQQYYCKAPCRIFSAGRLPSGFEQLLETYFGDLPLHNNSITGMHTRTPATEKKYRILNDENGVQGAIRIARPFPDRRHPDYKKAVILNAVFGGYFGSRLMANIREEKGYTYSIYSYLQNHIESGAWVISTEAGRDVCEATIEEVYKEMKELRDSLITDEELLLVKNYMLGINLGYMDGPFNVIAHWKNLILHNLDINYFNDSINTIRVVTAEELQQLANRYLKPEDFFELLVI